MANNGLQWSDLYKHICAKNPNCRNSQPLWPNNLPLTPQEKTRKQQWISELFASFSNSIDKGTTCQ